MWLNDMPSGNLQVTVDSVVVILREADMRVLGKHLAKRGMVDRADCYDPFDDNEYERLTPTTRRKK